MVEMLFLHMLIRKIRVNTLSIEPSKTLKRDAFGHKISLTVSMALMSIVFTGYRQSLHNAHCAIVRDTQQLQLLRQEKL